MKIKIYFKRSDEGFYVAYCQIGDEFYSETSTVSWSNAEFKLVQLLLRTALRVPDPKEIFINLVPQGSETVAEVRSKI